MNIMDRCRETCEGIFEYCPTFDLFDCTDCGASYKARDIEQWI